MQLNSITEALTADNRRLLSNYENDVQSAYAEYYAVASAFMKLVGRPALMQALVGTGMRSKVAMNIVLRIMTNLIRERSIRIPELVLRTASLMVKATGRRSMAAISDAD